jgi:1-deoxy-D-xylulose-5-phosphate reductoisomerase
VKRVLVLGSTGSIGTQALEVISAGDGLQVAGLSADSSWEALLE